MRVITVIGARPQFIKAAAVSRSFDSNQSADKPVFESILHTGQHYDPAMSDQFFEALGIPTPKFNLGVGGGTHAQNTGRMLEAIEKILLQEVPDAVLVYGDTDSTLAGALAASKLGIPVLHVEAGLRSYNRNQPEEQNRVLTDHLAEVCFAPTDTAVNCLLKEGINNERIVRCGDVMADSARIFGKYSDSIDLSTTLGFAIPEQFILATIHRAENTDSDQRLGAIIRALSNTDLPVLLPLHPRTNSRIREYGYEPMLRDIHICPPVGFLEMIAMEKKASLVVTDSGGVQKEAYLHSTPCLTLRDETEWVELLSVGWNKLVKPDCDKNIETAIAEQINFDRNSPRPEFYGDGHASEHIVGYIRDYLYS